MISLSLLISFLSLILLVLLYNKNTNLKNILKYKLTDSFLYEHIHVVLILGIVPIINVAGLFLLLVIHVFIPLYNKLETKLRD